MVRSTACLRKLRGGAFRATAEIIRTRSTAATIPSSSSPGGMKRRRLEIARGLLHTPKILFLDEPTLGLDPQTRNQLWTHVKKLNEDERTTVFLTTHYMEEAERVAQRIGIIDHGRIVAQGSPLELKQQTNAETLEQAFLSLTGSTDSRRGGRLDRPDA